MTAFHMFNGFFFGNADFYPIAINMSTKHIAGNRFVALDAKNTFNILG